MSARAPNVLLLSCYELGQQPFSLAKVHGFLRGAGVTASSVDLAVDAWPAAAVRAATLVAIATPMHTALTLGVHAARRVRAENPSAPISMFGLYASLNAEHLLREGIVDNVLGADAGPELLAHSLGARPPPHDLRRPLSLVPHRHDLAPLSRYVRLHDGGRQKVVGATETTTGCRHKCRHCPVVPVYQGRFFATDADVVAADIAQLVRAGAEHITFGDADFFNAPKHALTVARALNQAHPQVSFDATVKVEHIVRHADVVAELAALGLLFLVSAFESLDDRVLGYLDKGHTYADALGALAIARQAGIVLRPTFIAFTPWTTLADYVALIRFVIEHDLVHEVDPVQLTLRLLVPPKSLLLAEPALAPHLGALDAAGFSYAWTHPDPRMDRLQRDVAALVEDAAEQARVHVLSDLLALAERALGEPAAPTRWPTVRPASAHLSEPWFC